MENLKKCPFCGGEAELYQHYPYMRKRVLSTVRCKSCRANSGTWGRKDKAIESWNNRATEAELRANVIDEFAEAIMVKATELSEKVVFYGKLVGDALSLDCVSDMVVEIAEQMRKGEKE